MASLLILDDSIERLECLSEIFSAHFHVVTESNPTEALTKIIHQQFDGILIDIHMPTMTGFEFLNMLKKTMTHLPALFFCSSDRQNETRIKALEFGVKDVLWPSMNQEELILRVKNHLKKEQLPLGNIEVGKLLIDFYHLTATVEYEKLDLTLTEFKLLSILARSQNKPVDREELKEQTWPDIIVNDRTMNTHFANLRTKMARYHPALQIETIKNKGYMLKSAQF